MKNLYLAIWYGCNQRCIGCPIFHNENKAHSLTVEDIRGFLDQIPEAQYRDGISVTISGGEPTLHPGFFEILDELRCRDVEVCILTNADAFGNREYCDAFLQHVDILRTFVVTTIHGSNAEIHEAQNGTPGSLDRTISGLQYLSFRGLNVSIKHCITGKNYEDTADFIRFIDDRFHPSVDIQLWGIDYAGLTREQAANLYLPFSQMQEKIEEALDVYLEIRSRNYRRISLHNIPLCALDPYYWNLMPDATEQDFCYATYMDPTRRSDEVGDDSGKFSARCRECDVAQYCSGAYRSLFTYFGDDTVTPIHGVTEG